MIRRLIPYLLLASALILSAIPCRALLGETMEQCIARYGQPTSTKVMVMMTPNLSAGKSFIRFKANGTWVDAMFEKGIVVSESILKEDGSSLSDKEIESILQAETGKGKWSKRVSNDSSEYWLREDGTRACHVPHGVLTIESKALFDEWNPGHYFHAYSN